eukprot:scaffold12453_cov106-Isochrysis_galbana.AAC.2
MRAHSPQGARASGLLTRIPHPHNRSAPRGAVHEASRVTRAVCDVYVYVRCPAMTGAGEGRTTLGHLVRELELLYSLLTSPVVGITHHQQKTDCPVPVCVQAAKRLYRLSVAFMRP